MLTHKVNTGFFLAVIIFLVAYSVFNPLSWWAYLIPLALWFIITGLGSAFVQWGYHIKALNNGEKSGNKIAITFDDGPTPETIKVLELLSKYDVKATFFCIGKQIEKHPGIFKQIIDEGHVVGNHTFNHLPEMGFYSTDKILAEIVKTDELVSRNGLQLKLFRPPYGVTNPNMTKALKRTGHAVIGWNIRSLDTVINDENQILKRITTRLAPGSIILLHDTSQKTVKVLEQLLILLKQQNLKAVAVNELLNIPAYEE